jgi:hypothetical protein
MEQQRLAKEPPATNQNGTAISIFFFARLVNFTSTRRPTSHRAERPHRIQ